MSASARDVLASIDVEFSHNGEAYAFDLGSDNAAVAIAALSAAGFVIVPMEPTEEMLEAAGPAIDDYYDGTIDAPFEGGVRASYIAMLSAAEGKK